jgi:hypothetical protein
MQKIKATKSQIKKSVKNRLEALKLPQMDSLSEHAYDAVASILCYSQEIGEKNGSNG